MLACLLLLLTSCASKPAVRTETVTVERPVVVAVPAALTEPVPEPQLPAGELTNEDIVDHVDALRAALRQANRKLREIAGLPLDESP